MNWIITLEGGPLRKEMKAPREVEYATPLMYVPYIPTPYSPILRAVYELWDHDEKAKTAIYEFVGVQSP